MTKQTSAPSDYSDQPEYLPSLISLCCPYEESEDAQADLSLAGRTCHFVGFVVCQLE